MLYSSHDTAAAVTWTRPTQDWVYQWIILNQEGAHRSLIFPDELLADNGLGRGLDLLNSNGFFQNLDYIDGPGYNL